MWLTYSNWCPHICIFDFSWVNPFFVKASDNTTFLYSFLIKSILMKSTFTFHNFVLNKKNFIIILNRERIKKKLSLYSYVRCWWIFFHFSPDRKKHVTVVLLWRHHWGKRKKNNWNLLIRSSVRLSMHEWESYRNRIKRRYGSLKNKHSYISSNKVKYFILITTIVPCQQRPTYNTIFIINNCIFMSPK